MSNAFFLRRLYVLLFLVLSFFAGAPIEATDANEWHLLKNTSETLLLFLGRYEPWGENENTRASASLAANALLHNLSSTHDRIQELRKLEWTKYFQGKVSDTDFRLFTQWIGAPKTLAEITNESDRNSLKKALTVVATSLRKQFIERHEADRLAAIGSTEKELENFFVRSKKAVQVLREEQEALAAMDNNPKAADLVELQEVLSSAWLRTQTSHVPGMLLVAAYRKNHAPTKKMIVADITDQKELAALDVFRKMRPDIDSKLNAAIQELSFAKRMVLPQLMRVKKENKDVQRRQEEAAHAHKREQRKQRQLARQPVVKAERSQAAPASFEAELAEAYKNFQEEVELVRAPLLVTPASQKTPSVSGLAPAPEMTLANPAMPPQSSSNSASPQKEVLGAQAIAIAKKRPSAAWAIILGALGVGSLAAWLAHDYQKKKKEKRRQSAYVIRMLKTLRLAD